MKKLVLVTWYNSVNYGTCLQAYALYKKLCSLGFEVGIIQNMRFKKIFSIQDVIRRVKKRIVGKIASARTEATQGTVLEEGYQVRRVKKDKFIADNIKVIQVTNRKSFHSINEQHDIFVTGSDQIWNPYYLSPIALLDFVDDAKLKVAYATSVGVNKIPGDLLPVYKKQLGRFDYISVREQETAEYLTSMLNRDVVSVLDPTFFLTQEEIKKLETYSEGKELVHGAEKYIMCYFVGKRQEWVNKVRELSAETSLPVFVIMSENDIVPDVGTPITSAGIYDFLWMLDHAEYVCTDSFHCTALSMNLNKNFFVFKRFLDHDPNSQNSRIHNILKRFELEDRIIGNNADISEIKDGAINYDKVNVMLEKERFESEAFLKNAMYSDCGEANG